MAPDAADPEARPTARLDARARERTLDGLEAHVFDVAVIGGGITGAGVAREAARRGLRVALLEASDFAAGTSSRSSKLIHGGLRYLALGDVALVRETALERKRVHRLAPHLAEPCWMLVPARSRAGLLKFRAGIGTYERLGAVAEEDRHRAWGPEELARREPALRRDRTPWACVYREYLTDDARLVLANLRAAAARGAALLSRAPVIEILRGAPGARASGVVARCALSERRVRVRARCVVNAAGPWVEAVQRLEDAEAPALLHLSKGVHVVLPRARLPVRQIVILPTADRRSLFAIPRGDVVYLGTTDTSDADGARLWPRVEREDVEYLLEPVPVVFDVPPVRPEECIGAWAGLRPLVAQPGKPPTEISRRDEIALGPAGVVTVAGGKLTGYRKMAEDVLARAGEVLGDLPEAPDDDATPLPGGDFDGDLDALAARLAASARGLDAPAAARLARLYGSEAEAVLAADPAPLAAGTPLRAGELDWAVTHEGALTLEDALYRRTRAALYLPAAERDAAIEPAAARLAALLGWSAERARREADAVRARLASDLAFAAAPEGRPPAQEEARP